MPKLINLTEAEVDQKIAKLPLWAQDFIGQVERERDDARDELHTLKEGSLENAERQHFYVDNFQSEPFWLPQYGQLNFKQDPEREGFADFNIRKSDHHLGGVEVRSSGLNFSRDLVILPLVSNSVHIAVINR